MTRDQMINILMHPAINTSWFARKFYNGQKGAEKKFFAKIHGYGKQHFSSEEILRLKEVFIEFAEIDMDQQYEKFNNNDNTGFMVLDIS